MSALCAFGGAVDPLLSRKRGAESYGRPAIGHVEGHPEPRPSYNRVAIRLHDPVPKAGDAGGLGAVCAAIEHSVVFESVADDPAAAMRARRCENLDRAFEAIKTWFLPPWLIVNALSYSLPHNSHFAMSGLLENGPSRAGAACAVYGTRVAARVHPTAACTGVKTGNVHRGAGEGIKIAPPNAIPALGTPLGTPRRRRLRSRLSLNPAGPFCAAPEPIWLACATFPRAVDRSDR